MRFAGATLLGLGVIGAAWLPACANGLEGTSVDLSEVNSEEGGAGCAECPANHLCASGQCVPANTDSDGDGYDVRADCDDKSSAIHPGAPEICNGKDDDCNGKVDEGFDGDGDGVPTCAVSGKVADCDDKDPAVFPGAQEVCNNEDDDCNGKIDDGFDKDNDGFFSCAHGTIPVDCNDDDAKVKPGAAETCNGKDDDCNGKTDEIPATLTGGFAPVDAHWRLAGSAYFDTTLGWARLTDNIGDQAGALWWSSGYTFDTFDVTATIWIQSKSNGADGITFAWVPGVNVPTTGARGNSVGVVGLGGYAVGVDTNTNPGEPAAPFLAVYDATTGAHLLRAPLPDIRNGQNHTLRVRLDGGLVSAWIDGTAYINAFAISGYTPFAGHWGFTAATGGASAAHWVTGVTMSFPNGQGCVP